MRALRKVGVDRRHVQDRHQSPVSIENRRAGTTQILVARAEMLASVDGDGSFFGDARADTVRALDLLGPHAAQPGSPVFESLRVRLITAVLDHDTRRLAEEDGVTRVADQLIEPVDLLLRCED